MAESGSLTVNVGTYDSDYSLYNAPIGDVSGKNADNTSSYVEAIGSKGETNWIYWPFDVSQIPAGAQINAVSCRFRAWVSFVTYITPSASLCSGTTTKTGGVSFSDTTAKVYTVSGGTWTRDEIAKCRLKLTATFSSSSGASIGRRYFYLGGADLTVAYTYQNEKFMLKLGGKYNDVARVFKKVSGIWVEQEELANVIEDGVRYQNGGQYVAPKKTVTIKGTGNSSNGYVTINGTKYTSAATVQVEGGTTVGITLDCDMYNLLCKVTLNGTVVHENSTTNAETYHHIVDSDCTITLASTGSGGGYKADIVTT